MFNTPDDDITVNNYLVWDPKTREAAVVDTGTDVTDLLDVVKSQQLRVVAILITHSHSDHIASLPALVAATGAQVWSHEREPLDFPGARTFPDNAYFHLGNIAIKTLPTPGHSPGQTTFYVQGLSWPLALCGDSLFSASVGGSPTRFAEQIKNTRARIFSLPKDTVIGPGHGPFTTLAHERQFNPFFAPDRLAPLTGKAGPGPAATLAQAEADATAAPARAVDLPKRPRAGKAGRPDTKATPPAKPSKSAKPGRDGTRAFKTRRNRSA
jgi:glyoxylase-like metal-dependent hydrolase (beta-lactamase superfamily II)